jgi:hypothetical protein
MNLEKKGYTNRKETLHQALGSRHFYYDRRRPDGCGKDHFKISTVRMSPGIWYILFMLMMSTNLLPKEEVY